MGAAWCKKLSAWTIVMDSDCLAHSYSQILFSKTSKTHSDPDNSDQNGFLKMISYLKSNFVTVGMAFVLST
jgi:hypothetical protein